MKSTTPAAQEALINVSAIPDQGNDGNNELVAAPNPYPVYRRQSGATIHNAGALGSITVTLPTDANAGDRLFLDNVAGQQLKFDPGAAGLFLKAASTSTVGQKLICSTAGDYGKIVCVGAGPTWLLETPLPNDFSFGS